MHRFTVVALDDENNDDSTAPVFYCMSSLFLDYMDNCNNNDDDHKQREFALAGRGLFGVVDTFSSQPRVARTREKTGVLMAR